MHVSLSFVNLNAVYLKKLKKKKLFRPNVKMCLSPNRIVGHNCTLNESLQQSTLTRFQLFYIAVSNEYFRFFKLVKIKLDCLEYLKKSIHIEDILNIKAHPSHDGNSLQREEPWVAHFVVDDGIKHFFLIIPRERRLKLKNKTN